MRMEYFKMLLQSHFQRILMNDKTYYKIDTHYTGHVETVVLLSLK